MAQGTFKQGPLANTEGLDAILWQRVQDLFHRALALDGPGQREFLQTCQEQDAVAADILARLLEEDRNFSRAWESGLSSAVQQSAALEALSLPAENVGPYQFLRPLGQGGMGTVYQAMHRETGQIVAIKVLRSGGLSAVSRERFSTEQRALAKLNHRSIAQLYASESFRDGTPCFVMEYVEGEPLMTWCRNRPPVRDRVRLFRQICEAVQHAHQYGIIHRDLKPSNIMVKADGTVRLLDFGIAKQLDTEELTRDQPAPMTLAYAAPEQIAGGAAGTHTDVYALGLTLHEMLVLRPALDLMGLTPGGVEEAIRYHTPEPPSRLTKELGNRLEAQDLDLICEKAAHKDPERRYHAVQTLINDLDRWLAGEPIEARPDSIGYRLQKFARRNRRALTITAAVLFLVGASASWFTINLASARNAALREQIRTKRLEDFTLSLFDNGDPDSGPSKGATALTMLDRGRRLADVLVGEPQLQTDMFEVLGHLYYKLGRFKESGELLASVVKRRSGDPAITTKDRAASIFALATLRASQSRIVESERLGSAGLALVRNDNKSAAIDVANAKGWLGAILMESRKFKAAIPLLQDALRIQSERTEYESEQSKTLTALASAQQEAGDYVTAEKLMRQSLAIDYRVYGAVRPQVADDRRELGHIYVETGRGEQAVTEYQQALETYVNWYGKEHPSTVETLLTLGVAFTSLKRYQEAREALVEGMALGNKVLEPDNARMILAQETMGTLEQNTGNLPGAIANFDQALRRVRMSTGDQADVPGRLISNLAVAYFKAGDYTRAESLMREAYTLLVQHLPPGHQNIAIAQLNLGRVLQKEGKDAEAQENLQAALASLNRLALPRPDFVKMANMALEELRRSQR